MSNPLTDFDNHGRVTIRQPALSYNFDFSATFPEIPDSSPVIENTAVMALNEAVEYVKAKLEYRKREIQQYQNRRDDLLKDIETLQRRIEMDVTKLNELTAGIETLSGVTGFKYL